MQNPKSLRSRPNPPVSTVTGGPPRLLQELMSDILSRLPAKDLCRFKCVSKDFLSLISTDSQFKDLHRSRFSKTSQLLQFDLGISDGPHGLESFYKLSQSTFDLSTGQKCDKFDLVISKATTEFDYFIQVTSCRELVCVYSDRQILVLNPCTHQFIYIDVKNEILPNSVGIGYVDSSQEYKVVRINRAKNRLMYNDLGCEVYSLKDCRHGYGVSTIKFDGSPLDNHYDPGFPELLPICVDGVLYWMMDTTVVYYLNLKDNSYGKIPFLEGFKVEKDDLPKLIELQGYLCIQFSLSKSIAIYMLKDIKLGLWEQLYDIPYPLGIETRVPALDLTTLHERIEEYISYRPVISNDLPRVLGFLPSIGSGNGVPDFVVSEHIDDETSVVHTVEHGIAIKTSTYIPYNPRKTRRMLHNQGLFSFHKAITDLVNVV